MFYEELRGVASAAGPAGGAKQACGRSSTSRVMLSNRSKIAGIVRPIRSTAIRTDAW